MLPFVAVDQQKRGFGDQSERTLRGPRGGASVALCPPPLAPAPPSRSCPLWQVAVFSLAKEGRRALDPQGCWGEVRPQMSES